MVSQTAYAAYVSLLPVSSNLAPARKLLSETLQVRWPSIPSRRTKRVAKLFLLGLCFPVQMRVIAPEVAPFAQALMVAAGAVRALWDRNAALIEIGKHRLNTPAPL